MIEKVAASIWNCRPAAAGQKYDRLDRPTRNQIQIQAERIVEAIEEGVPQQFIQSAVDAFCDDLDCSVAEKEDGREA